jgi:hypothetical protein
MSDALQTKINEMFGQLMKDSYEGNQDAVRALVDEARRALIRADGTLPPWETAELEQAAGPLPVAGCDWPSLAPVTRST